MPIRTFEPNVRECIDACSNCYKSCVVTMQHCFAMGGEYADHSHINLLKDCAEISKITETFLLHNSQFATHTANLCAEICTTCAKECRQLDPEDGQMKSCADFCEQCAEACRKI